MIVGRLIRLRAIEPADLQTMVKWRNDPETMRSFFTFAPQSLDQQRRWYENLLQRQDERLYLIETNEGVAVGTAGFEGIDLKNQSAELGRIMIGERAYRGRGMAFDATMALLAYGFDDLNFHRVYLRVFASNEIAIRLYRKCGFKEEGVLREAVFAHGERRDVLVMGLLKDEFEMARADYGYED